MRALLALAVLALAACGGGTRPQAIASPTHPPTLSPTPVINVDDLMGLVAQQTVFVAANDTLSAVTLLNHYVRYTIPTNGHAQVTTDLTGGWLYVLDHAADGIARLRLFDTASGTERGATILGPSIIASDRRALATAADGRVLVLYADRVLNADRQRVWVSAYEALTMTPLGTVLEKAGCGDRLLEAAGWTAIVCLAGGEIALLDAHGDRATIAGVPSPLAAATMTGDGTIYVATADQRLGVVARGATKLVELPWPSDWSGAVLPDALAVSGAYGIVGERDAGRAYVRLFETANLSHRFSFPLAAAPEGGMLALFPFAYYTAEGKIRHVDLTSGRLESMTDIGAGAIPAAVINR